MGERSGGSTRLSEETVAELLADRRRRYLLYCLFRYTDPVTLATAAECVTERELHVPAGDLPQERLRVYMSLYRDHVPELEEAGVLAYHPDGDTLELTGRADQLEPHLRRIAERDLAPSDREWATRRG